MFSSNHCNIHFEYSWGCTCRKTLGIPAVKQHGSEQDPNHALCTMTQSPFKGIEPPSAFSMVSTISDERPVLKKSLVQRPNPKFPHFWPQFPGPGKVDPVSFGSPNEVPLGETEDARTNGELAKAELLTKGALCPPVPREQCVMLTSSRDAKGSPLANCCTRPQTGILKVWKAMDHCQKNWQQLQEIYVR